MKRRAVGKHAGGHKGRHGNAPPRRNPVARALRLTRPKVVPKATAYCRKRLAKPYPGDDWETRPRPKDDR